VTGCPKDTRRPPLRSPIRRAAATRG